MVRALPRIAACNHHAVATCEVARPARPGPAVPHRPPHRRAAEDDLPDQGGCEDGYCGDAGDDDAAAQPQGPHHRWTREQPRSRRDANVRLASNWDKRLGPDVEKYVELRGVRAAEERLAALRRQTGAARPRVCLHLHLLRSGDATGRPDGMLVCGCTGSTEEAAAVDAGRRWEATGERPAGLPSPFTWIAHLRRIPRVKCPHPDALESVRIKVDRPPWEEQPVGVCLQSGAPHLLAFFSPVNLVASELGRRGLQVPSRGEIRTTRRFCCTTSHCAMKALRRCAGPAGPHAALA